MANLLTIDLSQFDKLKDKLTNMGKELAEGVDSVLYSSAQDIAAMAKQKAPKNFGGLSASIAATNDKFLEKHITVNAFYAAFMEFGTGAYAAAYVSSLPPTWSAYASSFRGQKGGGTFAEMIINIAKWVHSKGIAGTYSVKTQRRTGSKKTQAQQDKELAYIIARSILIKGIKPHPFLFPAYEQTRPEIIKHIEQILNNLG